MEAPTVLPGLGDELPNRYLELAAGSRRWSVAGKLRINEKTLYDDIIS